MKIAILMSVYNGEKYIEKQLQSIKKQTLVDSVKLYIRDDGSTDNTIQIINDWKKKLNIELIKGENIGPALSFWELLTNQEISGDYFSLCDQDDIWDSDKLEVGIKFLKNYSLYCCNCRIIDKNDHIIEQYRKKRIPNITIPEIFSSGITQGCSMIFTKDFRDQICKLNIQTIPMHDLILSLYALYFGSIYWDLEPHFSYRFHDSNVIANEKKNLRKFINSLNKNYFYSEMANELLINIGDDLNASDKEFLNLMSDKKKMVNKIKMLKYFHKIKNNKRAKYSFYMRMFFGKF